MTLSILTNISFQLLDQDINEIDVEECNSSFYLFKFTSTSFSEMVDWDLSNFADLYTRPDDGLNQMPYSNGPVSFVAIIFRDSTNNLFVGATYESINRFKWLK